MDDDVFDDGLDGFFSNITDGGDFKHEDLNYASEKKIAPEKCTCNETNNTDSQPETLLVDNTINNETFVALIDYVTTIDNMTVTILNDFDLGWINQNYTHLVSCDISVPFILGTITLVEANHKTADLFCTIIDRSNKVNVKIENCSKAMTDLIKPGSAILARMVNCTRDSDTWHFIVPVENIVYISTTIPSTTEMDQFVVNSYKNVNIIGFQCLYFNNMLELYNDVYELLENAKREQCDNPTMYTQTPYCS